MKIAVVNVPRLEPHRPPPGPAIIAKVCSNHGHEVTAYDLNIKFFQHCNNNNQNYHSYDSIFDEVIDATPDQLNFINKFIHHWCSKIAQQNFDAILLSVFGMSGKVFAKLFLAELRQHFSKTIIAGGMGIGSFDLVDAENCFGAQLKKENLIDTFIVGEGEYSIIKALNGQSGPGINNNQFTQIDNLDLLDQPDYSFYNLDDYDYLIPHEKEVYITGSRGCVRKCTYCDVERFWPKYRYRSGQNIADEIICNYEKFGITRFYFTDSLVNGSIKAFNDMCDALSRYNFDQKISWSGQFIFRERRSIPKDHFKTMAKAGANILYVGIETGSDRVRAEMGKKFSNDDIEYQLEECSQYNIKVMPLMFTGYITETIEDHYDNLKFFQRYQKYVADGTIIGVELGSNLVILPGAPVERMIETHGLEFIMNKSGNPGLDLWRAKSNPDLTIRERIRRKLEVHETAIKYNWPVWRQNSRLNELKNLIIQNNLNIDDQQYYKIEKDKDTRIKKVIPIVAS